MQQLQIYNVSLTAQKYPYICILVYFHFICLFACLCNLHNESLRVPYHTASNGGMFDEWWHVDRVGGSCHGSIVCYQEILLDRLTSKINFRIFCLLIGVRPGYLQLQMGAKPSGYAWKTFPFWNISNIFPITQLLNQLLHIYKIIKFEH